MMMKIILLQKIMGDKTTTKQNKKAHLIFFFSKHRFFPAGTEKASSFKREWRGQSFHKQETNKSNRLVILIATKLMS